MRRLSFIVLLPLLAGCVANNQTIVKSTVFGLQVGPGPNGTPNVQFGLIRNLYVSNPTSTNVVHAAPLTTSAIADIGAMRQSGSEDISTK